MTIDVASAAVLRLLAERAPGATICPSEVARKIAGEATGYDEADWRNVMPVVHAAIDHQVEQGAHIEAMALQKDYAATGDKPALKAAAASIIPVVEKHIAAMSAMHMM